jgi:hypothetical protein
MAEKRVKVPFPTPQSPVVDGAEVLVKESNERWSEITLEDGTVIRIKPNVISAIRIDGQYDPEGNPMYGIKAGHNVTIVSSPESLRRPRAGSTMKN